MARGLMTALQAALAGVAGGASGYARYQELERKRQQEKAEAEERQALNLASLYERDFMTPEQFARQREELKVTEPAQRLTIGGQELVRARTPGESAARRELMRETMAQKGKTQEAKETKSALAAVLDQYGAQIRPEDREAVRAGIMGLPEALNRAQGRRPAPVDPMVARQRQSALQRSEAQTYVEASGGDANAAYRAYTQDNPRGTIPKREFEAAAYRARSRGGALSLFSGVPEAENRPSIEEALFSSDTTNVPR